MAFSKELKAAAPLSQANKTIIAVYGVELGTKTRANCSLFNFNEAQGVKQIATVKVREAIGGMQRLGISDQYHTSRLLLRITKSWTLSF